jgi:hypothetical protein
MLSVQMLIPFVLSLLLSQYSVSASIPCVCPSGTLYVDNGILCPVGCYMGTPYSTSITDALSGGITSQIPLEFITTTTDGRSFTSYGLTLYNTTSDLTANQSAFLLKFPPEGYTIDSTRSIGMWTGNGSSGIVTIMFNAPNDVVILTFHQVRPPSVPYGTLSFVINGVLIPTAYSNKNQHKQIRALTRNIYIGFDVDAVIAAIASGNQTLIALALTSAVSTLNSTSFYYRAAALADDICRTRPHVIGLQEVTIIDVDLPGIVIHLNYLDILLDALDARGCRYAEAVKIMNTEAIPSAFGGKVRLVDYDVLLVDSSCVKIKRTRKGSFTNNIGTVTPGVTLVRGWVMVDIAVNGRRLVVASTHLESSGPEGLRLAQINELLPLIKGPAILMGDLNATPDSLVHLAVIQSGFTDAWIYPSPGYTCCHSTDLSNALSELNTRVDYVFTRDFSVDHTAVVDGRIIGPVYPIWPSDHAGVLAALN